MINKKKINVGCGKDIKPKNEGWINLDQHNKHGAEVIFDLNKLFERERETSLPRQSF